MSGVCSCIYIDCKNKDICKRPKIIGEPIDFKFICNEDNGYYHIIKIEESITEIKE